MAWSEAARKAAAEARRLHKHGIGTPSQRSKIAKMRLASRAALKGTGSANKQAAALALYNAQRTNEIMGPSSRHSSYTRFNVSKLK